MKKKLKETYHKLNRIESKVIGIILVEILEVIVMGAIIIKGVLL